MSRILFIRRAEKIKTKHRSVLQVQFKHTIKETPIRDIETLVILGRNIHIESSVFSVLASHNIPVAIIAKDNVSIHYNPTIIVNPETRHLQHTLPEEKRLEIAYEYIKAKLKGMYNILVYKRVKVQEEIRDIIEAGTRNLEEAEIRLWESTTSNKLWKHLIKLINNSKLVELKIKYGFNGRKPRHPDPFNKTLSVMYAVLYSLGTRALLSAGLDPTTGFLHKSRYSTPLTFDYVEMFKPVAIHATINLVNTYNIELGDDLELTYESVKLAIKTLYEHLALKHRNTGKSIYQYIYLKAFRLANYIKGKTDKRLLVYVYNRSEYKAKN